MTRFLKDFKLIPEGYLAYCDKDGNHYYLLNEKNEVIDLTIYQGLSVSFAKQSGKMRYYPQKARFYPVRNGSTKDALILSKAFNKSLPATDQS